MTIRVEGADVESRDPLDVEIGEERLGVVLREAVVVHKLLERAHLRRGAGEQRGRGARGGGGRRLSGNSSGQAGFSQGNQRRVWGGVEVWRGEAR